VGNLTVTGNLNNSHINVYGAAAVATIKVAGSLKGDTLTARHGIGSLTVGRDVDTTHIVADDADGRIAALTTGSFKGVTLSANPLGTVRIGGSGTPGDIVNSTIVMAGAAPVGIASFLVQGGFKSGTLIAPGGIPTVSVGGSLGGPNSVVTLLTDNP